MIPNMNRDRSIETTRISVTLPEYLLEEWDEEVQLEEYASRSEWVRIMVEAGRSQFDQIHPVMMSSTSRELQQDILSVLNKEESETDDELWVTWDEIREEILGETEKDIDHIIEQLVQDGILKHSPRKGGYKYVSQ